MILAHNTDQNNCLHLPLYQKHQGIIKDERKRNKIFLQLTGLLESNVLRINSLEVFFKHRSLVFENVIGMSKKDHIAVNRDFSTGSSQNYSQNVT